MNSKENEDCNKMPVVQQASEYLEKHQIYELFSSLMSSLAINRPSKPKQFIIQQLSSLDPCKICVISNDSILLEQCIKILKNQFKKVKVFSFDSDEAKSDDFNQQIKILQSEKDFILNNYPTNKQQALFLLESRIIPDRIFLITKQSVENLDKDKGKNDLIALSNVFKHNSRIICYNDEDTDYLQLEQSLMSSYYEQKRSFNNYLAPKFAPRVIILGPPSIGKTKIALAIKERMNLNYLNAAHILNQHIAMHSDFGIKAEEMVKNKDENKHCFVSNDLMVQMMANDICKDGDILSNGYIMDSFPRNMEQTRLMIKYGVLPNRIIILKATDSFIIEKGQSKEYLSDYVQTPGFDANGDADVTTKDLLDGYKKNIDEIKMILCDKKERGCNFREFDVEKVEEGKLLELAYDFIIQPLTK